MLETNRYRLRVFESSDLDILAEMYADEESMRFMRGVRTREQAEEHIRLFAEQFEQTRFTLWAVEQKSDRAVIGRVGLWPLPETTETELGYAIVKSHWGQGIATETSIACLDYAFEELQLEFVSAIAQAKNTASLRVMQKLGLSFIREARFYDTDVRYHRIEKEHWLQHRKSL
jgi:ribosomal-protein-alanine N-acetyltransferase